MSRVTPPCCLNSPRNLLAMAICMATLAPAFADDSSAVRQTSRPTTLELGATEVTSTHLGSTTEGTSSYTTGAMSTATKLPLTMRETPQAVTVITRQRMDDQAMTSINDVVNATPGLFLNYSSGPGRQSYSARGFDIDNLMYDGIPSGYRGAVVGAQPNLAMFDRVEVVRGATGLVTGAGNPSAAINMVRKRPLDEQKVTLTGAAGTWDNYRGEVDASSPLNDSGTWRGRVVTSYRDSNSFVDDVDEQHGLFYAITEADLGEDTTLTLGFSNQKDKTNYFWGSSMIGLDGHHLDLPRSYNPGLTGRTRIRRSTPCSPKSASSWPMTGSCSSTPTTPNKMHCSPALTSRAGSTTPWPVPSTSPPTTKTRPAWTPLSVVRSKHSGAAMNWWWAPASASTT